MQSCPSEEQGVRSVLAGFEQIPVPGLQLPGSWHSSGTGQTTPDPGMHEPLEHASLSVQPFPSLQLVPSPRLPQWPSLPALLHATQSFGSPLPQTLSQHRPSMHPPAVAHSRQPDTLQSTTSLQTPAVPSCGAQSPAALQK